MASISSYITFNGNCREAMTFYQECLGGELTFQTVGESPLPEGMPEQLKKTILHAMLINGDLTLMASDMVPENGLVKGNSVSLLLRCSSEQEIRDCYDKLSQDGKQTFPVSPTFYGALHGNLTDKFGNHWLLHYHNSSRVLSR